MILAGQAWERGRVDLMRQHLQELVPGRPEDPDLRGFEWFYQDRLRNRIFARFGGTRGCPWRGHQPDGRLIASSAADQTAKLWDTVTGREVHTLEGTRRS